MQSLCQVHGAGLPERHSLPAQSAPRDVARDGAPMPTHGAPPAVAAAGSYQPRKRGQWAATRPESSWMTW